MRRIKLRSGGFLFVLRANEPNVDGQICMNEAEYAWILKISGAMHSLPEREELWSGVLERKKADPNYSVFDSFPADQESKDKQSLAVRYSQEIIAMLKGQREAESNG